MRRLNFRATADAVLFTRMLVSTCRCDNADRTVQMSHRHPILFNLKARFVLLPVCKTDMKIKHGSRLQSRTEHRAIVSMAAR